MSSSSLKENKTYLRDQVLAYSFFSQFTADILSKKEFHVFTLGMQFTLLLLILRL